MTNDQITTSIDAAVSSLVGSRLSEEGTVVSLPSVYSSGAPVQVRVSFDGNKFFVNDMGNAFTEALLMGATSKQFVNQAREVATEYGVLFDNHSFFAVHADTDRLPGAIRIVAAASLKSVLGTESKMTEQNDSTIKKDFMLKIEQAFGRTRVSRDFEFTGQSTHRWKFAARIDIGSSFMLFDTASEVPMSVYSAHAKFSDLLRLDRAPKGIIGVPSFKTLKPDYRNLLQQVANVVEADVDLDTLTRLAA